MMKTALYLLAILTACSSGGNPEKVFTVHTHSDKVVSEAVDTVRDNQINLPSVLPESDSSAYADRKDQAEALRVQLKAAFAKGEISIDSVGRAFEHFITHYLFPHWYGTTWAYEGHTDTPGDGEVACGYFVSTTLRHMNLQVNRYHLAQEAAWNAAKSLAIQTDSVKKYSQPDVLEHSLHDGLYLVGLSYHVGYLWKKEGNLLFIHSNYLGDSEVMVEKASESEALLASDIFVTIRIGNPHLMKKWLDQSQLYVFRQ